MAWCAVMSFYFQEDDQLAFLMSLLVTFGCGFLFLFLGRNAENSLSRRDAYLLVTAVWVIFSFFGIFPFMFHGSITNLTDAFFAYLDYPVILNRYYLIVCSRLDVS